MTMQEILKLNGELITEEQLEAIEESECVLGTENNGSSGGNKFYGRKWVSVKFNKTFIDSKCDDVDEIQVYL